jgi:hypothetical protein
MAKTREALWQTGEGEFRAVTILIHWLDAPRP